MSGRIEDQLIEEGIRDKRSKGRRFLKIRESKCRECGWTAPGEAVVVCGGCGGLLVERMYEKIELPEGMLK